MNCKIYHLPVKKGTVLKQAQSTWVLKFYGQQEDIYWEKRCL